MMDLKTLDGKLQTGFIHLAQDRVGYYEQGPSGFIKCWKFLEY
jgi:hypothetical protein